jgi:hypothetical protein
MNEKVKPQEIFVFLGIFVLMIGTLLYGFFFAGVGQVENCWDKWQTENEAIMHCETHGPIEED